MRRPYWTGVLNPPCSRVSPSLVRGGKRRGLGLKETELRRENRIASDFAFGDRVTRVDDKEFNQRLSQIDTSWSLVYQAHGEEPDQANEARRLLMERYSGAVYRYLVASLRDQHAADELGQEFALRFIRGDFRGANAERGRFRGFVKTAVLNLIVDYHRRQRARNKALPSAPTDQAQMPDDFDRMFLNGWRDELLSRALEALARESQRNGQLFHVAMRVRAEHSELRSAELAKLLSAELNKTVTADWVRQTLHRARAKLCELIIIEVAHSLENPTDDQIEEELGELELLEYCRGALKGRGKGATKDTS